jgi:hypothetical protein
MNGNLILEDVISRLERRYGRGRQLGKGRVLTFGNSLTCSINYSKLLGGHKYFYAVPQGILDTPQPLPKTKLGAFVLLVCGSADKVLVLPRELMLDLMRGVKTRRVDVFLDSGSYIVQTTKHPKCNATQFLNAFPGEAQEEPGLVDEEPPEKPVERLHVKMQWSLITLGKAEGCSVWVPANDRNLSFGRKAFSDLTLARLPNFGFDEITRHIVQNIDVLWLTKNVIQKAFEIEATTSVYSGLLRMNDLVLAQPNIQIDLFLAAPRSRRDRVQSQLFRPSFQSLAAKCQFLTFEDVESQMERLQGIPLDKGARVSGLVRGEKFEVPEHYVYPTNLS